MKKVLFVGMLAMASMTMVAQEVPKAPELTTSDKVAVRSLLEKLDQNRQEQAAINDTLRQIVAEFAQQHPGFHLDEKLQVVREAPSDEGKSTK